MGAGKCPACEAPIPPTGEDEFEHFIPLLPNIEVKDKLRERLLVIRQREQAERKKAKKAAKAASSSTPSVDLAASSPSSDATSSLPPESHSSSSTTAATTSTTPVAPLSSKTSKKSPPAPSTTPSSSFLDGVKFTGLSKEEQREERKKKRKLEATTDAKTKVTVKVDERAAEDPRFKSQAFASIFMPRGMDDSRNRKEYMSGISTKALSQMSYL